MSRQLLPAPRPDRHDRPLRPPTRHRQSQRGGFGVGLIVGLLIGLALALGVALYVTKVPVPFVNKVPQRSQAQDTAEAEKNKNWDPNSPLYGKNPARPSAVASGVVTPATGDPGTALNGGGNGNGASTGAGTAATTPPVATVPPTASWPASAGRSASAAARASAPSTGRDPAAILTDRAAATRSTDGFGGVPGAGTGANTGTPPGGGTVSTTGGADPFTYFVQAGAYGTPEDAEQQRARLAMMGLEARLSERDQAGRTVHRVRLGPFDSKADADSAKDRLGAAGIESTLVRVQR